MNKKENSYGYNVLDNDYSTNEKNLFKKEEKILKKESVFNTTEFNLVKYCFDDGEVFEFTFHLKKIDLK